MDTRGEYRFSSLVKLKKKEKNSAVFYFAGKRDFFIYIYEVITWEKKKSSTNYYSRARARESKRERERMDGYVWGRASEGKMIKRAPERHDNNVQF